MALLCVHIIINTRRWCHLQHWPLACREACELQPPSPGCTRALARAMWPVALATSKLTTSYSTSSCPTRARAVPAKMSSQVVRKARRSRNDWLEGCGGGHGTGSSNRFHELE